MSRTHAARAAGLILFLFLLSPPVQAGPASPAPEKMHLRVGFLKTVFTEVDVRDAKAAIELWMRKILAAEGITSEMFAYDTLPSVVEGLREGDIDLVSIDTLTYLKIRDETRLEPILVGVRGGSPCEEYLLAVRRNGRIGSVDGLKGSTLNILVGSGGAVAMLWLDTVLMKKGLPPCRELCKSVKTAGRESQALLPVFFGQADACLLSRRAYRAATARNPQLTRALRIIGESPPYLRMVSCYRGDGDAALRDAVVRSALSLGETPAGTQLLTLLNLDRIAAFEPPQIESAERLAREHAALLREKAGRREVVSR